MIIGHGLQKTVSIIYLIQCVFIVCAAVLIDTKFVDLDAIELRLICCFDSWFKVLLCVCLLL